MEREEYESRVVMIVYMRDAIDADEGTSTMEYATVSLVDVDTDAIVFTSKAYLNCIGLPEIPIQHTP